MSHSIRRKPALRKPLAIVSALALSACVALTFAPNANANAAGSPIPCDEDHIAQLQRATGGVVVAPYEIDGICYVFHLFGDPEDSGARFSGTFEVAPGSNFPMDYLIFGGGGGGGGGSGWENSTKADGIQPISGAGAGGAGGDAKEGTVTITAPGSYAVVTGSGGAPGTAGTATAGSTAGGQGGSGGESSFNPGDLITASGGAGGFGGTGIEAVAPVSYSPVVQGGVSATPTAAGEYGGNNSSYVGGTRADSPYEFAGPGGAGSGQNGYSPTGANGGNGGEGFQTTILPTSGQIVGGGGGGGTLNATSYPVDPYAARVGGSGGLGGGAGGSTGDGGRGTFGSGGGGGSSDGSYIVGESNAGDGGVGGGGVVILRYVALTAPATPAAPAVVAGDGQVTATITPLDDTPDSYTVFVVGDAGKSCTITPPATSCVIDGLVNGTDYTFEVKATNANVDSVNSDPSLIATPSAPTTTQAPTTTTPDGPLPYTGSDSRGLVSMAFVMIAIGGAVTVFARRSAKAE